MAHCSYSSRARVHITQISLPRCVSITSPAQLTSKCECGHAFSVDHALPCTKGGFPALRHNEIRDITASLFMEVCSDVHVEPDLQSVTPNQLDGALANSQDGARLEDTWLFLTYESSTPLLRPTEVCSLFCLVSIRWHGHRGHNLLQAPGHPAS